MKISELTNEQLRNLSRSRYARWLSRNNPEWLSKYNSIAMKMLNPLWNFKDVEV